MKIVKILATLCVFFLINNFSAKSNTFENWKDKFKKIAIKEGISESTIVMAMKKVKFLPKVIDYDRYQPEFYEDTKTYISKRSSKKK